MPEMIEIKLLKPLESNPRKITKEQMQKCMNSLSKDPDFLQHRPILVNKTQGNHIVYAGNQRVLAAKKLGWKQILCSIDFDLPEEEMKRRVVLDNQHFGEFDFDMLANEFDVEMLIETGFDVDDLVGKDIEEINAEEKPKNKQKKHMCPSCGYEF